MLPASHGLGLVSLNGFWVEWAESGDPPDGHAQGEVHGRVITRAGITGSVPTDLGEFSVSTAGEGPPRAVDGSCILQEMYCKGKPGAAGEAHHSCSSGPLNFSLSGSSTLMESGALGSTPLKSTSIRDGSQAGSSALATFQGGSFLKSNSRALRPPFSPPRANHLVSTL